MACKRQMHNPPPPRRATDCGHRIRDGGQRGSAHLDPDRELVGVRVVRVRTKPANLQTQRLDHLVLTVQAGVKDW